MGLFQSFGSHEKQLPLKDFSGSFLEVEYLNLGRLLGCVLGCFPDLLLLLSRPRTVTDSPHVTMDPCGFKTDFGLVSGDLNYA